VPSNDSAAAGKVPSTPKMGTRASSMTRPSARVTPSSPAEDEDHYLSPRDFGSAV